MNRNTKWEMRTITQFVNQATGESVSTGGTKVILEAVELVFIVD